MEPKHSVIVLLGSNIDPERNMPAAFARLARHPHLTLVGRSRVYSTEPVGGQGPQPRFANAAVHLHTHLTPGQLRRALRELEAEMGRVRTADKYAPRPIDMDIVLYDDFVGSVDGSPIPDPDLLRHPHVAIPCGALAPERRHPITGQTLAEIAATMDRSTIDIDTSDGIDTFNGEEGEAA